jgi:hypothetical protein
MSNQRISNSLEFRRHLDLLPLFCFDDCGQLTLGCIMRGAKELSSVLFQLCG